MSKETNSKNLTRIHSLDALRGLAVFLMIEQHLGVWLWEGPSQGRSLGEYPLLLAFNGLGGLAAPLFITLAGIGTTLFVQARTKNEGQTTNCDISLFRRGLVLFGFAYLLSFLTPSWFSWQSWFVLHLMAFGMILSPLLRRFSSKGLLLGAFTLLVGTALLQSWLDTPLSLSNPYMSGRSHNNPPHFFWRAALAESQFPIFPWLSFFLCGMVVGRWLRTTDFLSKTLKLAGAFLGGAIVLASTTHLLAKSSHDASWLGRLGRLHVPFFPISPALACALLCAVLLLIFAARKFEPLFASANHPLVSLGRGSLTLLLAHVVIFRELTRPIGWWQAMSMPAAWTTLVATVIVSLGLCILWQRSSYKFGAEWLLRKLS